jgi:hypothetical protein
LLRSQQNSSVASLDSVATPAPNELEYLDVFELFNYPRLPAKIYESLHILDSTADSANLEEPMDGLVMASFASPTPEWDWLTFIPSH